MNKHAILLTLSIITVIVPFLGFPSNWKSFFTVVLGLAAAVISYRLYRQDLVAMPKPKMEERPTTYTDNLHS